MYGNKPGLDLPLLFICAIYPASVLFFILRCFIFFGAWSEVHRVPSNLINSFFTEAVVQTCSVKKVFLEILQYSQENICARVCFLINETLAKVFFCEFSEISRNTFFHRAPLVAASFFMHLWSYRRVMLHHLKL